MCSAALRRYLADEDCRPAKPLIAGVLVSLREAGNTDLNNQVSMMFVGLATDIKDPLQRLKAIRANAVGAKEVTSQIKTAIPTDFPSFGAPWLMSGLASLYGRSRLANVIPPLANVAISNVPGSPVPLYLAGARVASYIPVSIPGHGVALNITVQSYDGVLGLASRLAGGRCQTRSRLRFICVGRWRSCWRLCGRGRRRSRRRRSKQRRR